MSDAGEADVNKYILVEEHHRVLLCRLCHSAVRPGLGVEDHFRHAHQVKGKELQEIKYYVADMDLSDPSHAAMPRDGSAPIGGLETLRGYGCKQCRYYTRACENIRRHWRTADHGPTEAGMRWKEVLLQTWSQGRYVRYWEVRNSGEQVLGQRQRHGGAEEGGRADADSGLSMMERKIREFEAELTRQDAERLRRGDVEEGLERESAWVKRLGWSRHLGARDLLAIHEAAEWINARSAKEKRRWGARSAAAAAAASSPLREGLEEEEGDAERERESLERLNESFNREVERCCLRLEGVPVETLQRLHSISPTDPSSRVFGRRETSMGKYKSVGQRFLGFSIRAFRTGRDNALERLGAQFTDEQWSLLGDVDRELRRTPGGGAHTQDSGFWSESEDDDDGDDDDDDEHGGLAGSSSSSSSSSSGRRRTRREDGSGSEASLDRAVFRFMVASVKVRVPGKVYTNALLCFCAALGIRRQPLGFTEPQLYTGLLAAVLWWCRLFFLEASFEGSTNELEEVDVDALLRFRDEQIKWMCFGTHTVISTIIGWMSYGKGHRVRTGGQPSVRWDEKHEALFHQGERVAVADFKETFRGLVTETESLLDRMMSGGWEKESRALDLGRIRDRMVRMGAGQSFATAPENDWLEAGPGKLMRLGGSRLWDASRNRWKTKAAKRWFSLLRPFRENLMVLTHVWGGQPGRGPEVTTMRHCDSWQLTRNVFLLDGEVMLVTDRDKMKAIRDIGRKVARFLPPRIGKMMVAYIAWLLPFERVLLPACGKMAPRDDHLEFLWRDGSSRAWQPDRLSVALARVTAAGVGVRLGVARYRPIAIEFGRRIRGLVMKQVEAHSQDQEEGEDEDDNVDVDPLTGEPVYCGGSWNIVWDLQSTHGTRVAMQHYAVHIGFPGKLQPELVATFREISRLWHQFLESSSTEAQPTTTTTTTTTRTRTATTGSKRKDQPQPEDEGLASSGAKRRRTSTTGGGGGGERDIVQEMERGLRALFGSGASWRSDKQAESMRTILGMGAGEVLISVLPTGAGKSILFMLPAVLRGGGTTIVVVPFVALRDDLVDRAREMGVDCIPFLPTLSAGRETQARAGRLVVVTADVATGAEFSSYADGLLCAGLLQRIFVDECHTAITDVEFRARLGALKSLHRYGCPLVLLTATLPVVLEDWFRREMLATSATTIRDRTTKANCQYRVEQVEPGPGRVQARTMELARRVGGSMTGTQKGVVYCRTKAACESLAAELGCDFYHSGMAEQARRETLRQWTSGRGGGGGGGGGGEHRWITATTGLGTGVDIEGIVAIIHMGMPYGLVDFVQQTGRGARRAGEVVMSTIVHDGLPNWSDPHQSFVDECNKSHISTFVSTTGCRRAVISAFMDGVAGETCGSTAGAEACDNCRPAAEATAGRTGKTAAASGNGGGTDEQMTSSRWTRHGKEEGTRQRLLLRWLDEVGGGCAVCHVRRHLRASEDGSVPDRPAPQDDDDDDDDDDDGDKGCRCGTVAGEEYETVRRRVTFGQNSCCFMCKLPLDWCIERRAGEAAEREGPARVSCSDMDKVMPVVFMAYYTSEVFRIARDDFGINPLMDGEGFYRWLGGRRRFHGTNGTNALALWEAIITKVYRNRTFWFRV